MGDVPHPAPSVILCEDDADRRAAVTAMLVRTGCTLVGEVASLQELSAVLGTAAADVLVLDLALAGLGGLEVIRNLRLSRPATEVVVLSEFPSLSADAVAAGARVLVDVRDLRVLESLLLEQRTPLPRTDTEALPS